MISSIPISRSRKQIELGQTRQRAERVHLCIIIVGIERKFVSDMYIYLDHPLSTLLFFLYLFSCDFFICAFTFHLIINYLFLYFLQIGTAFHVITKMVQYQDRADI